MAIAGGGKTFIGLIFGEDDPNDVAIIEWDNVARTYDGPVELIDQLNEGGGTIPDTHNQCAVTRRADGHLVVAVSGHGGNRVYTFVSNGTDVASGFHAGETIVSSYALTYMQLFRMAGGRLYMRARAVLGGAAYILQWYSDDGGETWDIGTLVFTEGTENIYTAAATDGTYVDQIFIDRAPSFAGGWWMGHGRMDESGAWYRSDGTPIVSGFPLGASELTEVFPPGSYRFPRDIVYNVAGDGMPVLGWDSAQQNPVLMGESRFNGTLWIHETIATSGPVYSFASSTGGGKHAWNDPDTFYAGELIGDDPIDLGGAIEMFKHKRTAGVWGPRQQITHAGRNPYGPFAVVDAEPELSMLWTYGDQAPADGDPFSLGLEGVAA